MRKILSALFIFSVLILIASLLPKDSSANCSPGNCLRGGSFICTPPLCDTCPTCPVTPPGVLTNPSLNSFLQGLLVAEGGIGYFRLLLPNFVGLAFIIGVLVFFAMLVIGGIQWIASGGDKASLEAAKGRLTNAVIGIIILFAFFAIVSLTESFFGVSILTLDIGPLKIQ